MVRRVAMETAKTIRNLIICWCVWFILDALTAIIKKGGNKNE